MSAIRGADRVVQTLEAAGVTRVFTLSGNHIMPVFDAMLDVGIDLIHTRHEAAAVHMADAWARLTGEAGIALVTGGPGHANAVSALYTAQMSEAPVVLLSGHAPNGELGSGAFQEMNQSEMAAPVTKASWVCADAAQLGRDVARAMRTARAGRPGPVHLSLPTDVLEAKLTAEARPREESFVPDAMPLSMQDAREMLQLLTAASRPLILTGPATLTRSGREQMQALGEALGIPVIGMESPRGVNDPALGAFSEVLAEADCILLLGKRLDFTLRFGKAGTFDENCKFMQIDAESGEFDRTRRAVKTRLARTALADTTSASASLAAAGKDAGRRHEKWTREVRSAIRYRPPSWDQATSALPGRLHPVQICRPLQSLLDSHPDSVMVSDGGEFGQWAQACLTAPNRIINGPAGAIGSALPMALAARIAKPDAPVVAFMGDGTFGFHMAEIDTAVRYRLPIIAVVGNDSRWNAEYQIQLKAYGPARLVACELLPTRYDLVTAALGGHGEHVDAADALNAAVERAYRSRQPSCINVAMEGVPAPIVRRERIDPA